MMFHSSCWNNKFLRCQIDVDGSMAYIAPSDENLSKLNDLNCLSVIGWRCLDFFFIFSTVLNYINSSLNWKINKNCKGNEAKGEFKEEKTSVNQYETNIHSKIESLRWQHPIHHHEYSVRIRWNRSKHREHWATHTLTHARDFWNTADVYIFVLAFCYFDLCVRLPHKTEWYYLVAVNQSWYFAKFYFACIVCA